MYSVTRARYFNKMQRLYILESRIPDWKLRTTACRATDHRKWSPVLTPFLRCAACHYSRNFSRFLLVCASKITVILNVTDIRGIIQFNITQQHRFSEAWVQVAG